MTMEDKRITNQESLELIARMIRNTQDRFERGAGKPFLIWGYTTVAVSLAVWYMVNTTGDYQWNWLWFALPLIGSFGMLAFMKKGPKSVKTFIDSAINQVWFVLGLCAILVSCYAMVAGKHLPTLMIISILILAAQAITGGIIKLPYIKIMGLAGIVLAFGLPCLKGVDQILGFAGLFFIAMVIPGHIMNLQARKRNKIKN